MGSPYVIYNSLMEQEEIYYFPIAYNGSIVSVITVLNTVDGYVYQYGEDIAEYLNCIDYLETNPVLYEYKNAIYAENEEHKVCLYSFSPLVFDKKENRAIEQFHHLSYTEKCHVVGEKIQNMIVCMQDESTKDCDLQERMKAYTNKISLYKPMGQYGHGMCWAASVATVVNYRKTSAVNPYEVCNKMGIGYETGGSIYDEQQALSLYGVSYAQIAKSPLGWETIKNNVDSKYPIIANLKCNDGTYNPHAVTIYDYDPSGKRIKYWDSNLGNGNGGSGITTFASSANSFLAMQGHSFSWKTALSKK